LEEKHDINNRGQKRANFHVLRETNMSAIMLEVLFIDHEHNVQLLSNHNFQEKAASAIATGIANSLSLSAKKKKKPPQQNLYRVIAGSFKNKKKAKSRVAFLKQQQINAFIKKTDISG